MLFLLILIAVVCILIWGHYGFPEEVNPNAFQEDPSPKDMIKGAEPYRLEGKSETAILLVHGFEGSPYVFRSLAELLHKKGYTVIAPLLPGHGTSVNHFKKTRYEHWFKAVHDLYIKERPKYKHFFLLGFSLGGNLCLKTMITVPENISPTGLIAISTPVCLNGILNGKIIIKDWRLLFSGFLKEFLPYLPKKRHAASGIINPWTGYSDVYTSNCIHSLKINAPKIRKFLPNIKVPVCLMQARNDKTIHSENLHYLFRNIGSKKKYAFMFDMEDDFSTRHVIVTHEQTKNQIYHYISRFLEDILNQFDKKSFWGIAKRKRNSLYDHRIENIKS